MDSCLTLQPPLYLRARWALQSALARFAAYFAKEEEPASRADVNARAAAALDEYGNAILRYAYSFLHNMADAEEVLQDTLLQMLKIAERFDNLFEIDHARKSADVMVRFDNGALSLAAFDYVGINSSLYEIIHFAYLFRFVFEYLYKLSADDLAFGFGIGYAREFI